ncbi:MAG: pseudouridine synthase, RluA family [Stenotrophomonas indicatrix]|uniref:Pseudouridine synthase n=2 Tax=Stenotrophomonas indicatrix TaxID=2045451 RepID=A0A1W1GTU5_9GAMM|nr:pseudouridine synthase, RluA family [Stenotrophomonas indicatrix]SLM22755.1 ribosomal large subunit pseudouridine synthase C [Stenotrophomonas indicatrix]
MAGNAGEPLTWPPRGRWSRTVPDSSEAGLLALSNFQRNQSLISPPECNRINRLMTAQDPTKPAGDKPSVRMITVPADRAGQRLDNFLLGQLKGAPRSLVYKLVRSGQVRVNGGRAKAERKLEAGDEVRIPPVRLSEEGDKAGPPEAFMRRLEQAIVFEDARLLALNKPTGVASHGGSGISFGAIETLRALRPGQTLELVHRLDRDTSGLLIVAKKRSALSELQALLREDHGAGIRKRYLTLLAGRMPDGVMTVDAPLHVGLRQGGERHVQVNAIGKESISHFRVLERKGGHSYCEVRIETGRTHQIRVHAQHLGHPVAGDDKYGDPAVNKRLREQIGLKRLFLHAASLEFALDDGKSPYVLNAPLADELVEALDRLR